MDRPRYNDQDGSQGEIIEQRKKITAADGSLRWHEGDSVQIPKNMSEASSADKDKRRVELQEKVDEITRRKPYLLSSIYKLDVFGGSTSRLDSNKLPEQVMLLIILLDENNIDLAREGNAKLIINQTLSEHFRISPGSYNGGNALSISLTDTPVSTVELTSGLKKIADESVNVTAGIELPMLREIVIPEVSMGNVEVLVRLLIDQYLISNDDVDKENARKLLKCVDEQLSKIFDSYPRAAQLNAAISIVRIAIDAPEFAKIPIAMSIIEKYQQFVEAYCQLYHFEIVVDKSKVCEVPPLPTDEERMELFIEKSLGEGLTLEQIRQKLMQLEQKAKIYPLINLLSGEIARRLMLYDAKADASLSIASRDRDEHKKKVAWNNFGQSRGGLFPELYNVNGVYTNPLDSKNPNEKINRLTKLSSYDEVIRLLRTPSTFTFWDAIYTFPQIITYLEKYQKSSWDNNIEELEKIFTACLQVTELLVILVDEAGENSREILNEFGLDFQYHTRDNFSNRILVIKQTANEHGLKVPSEGASIYDQNRDREVIHAIVALYRHEKKASHTEFSSSFESTSAKMRSKLEDELQEIVDANRRYVDDLETTRKQLSQFEDGLEEAKNHLKSLETEKVKSKWNPLDKARSQKEIDEDKLKTEDLIHTSTLQIQRLKDQLAGLIAYPPKRKPSDPEVTRKQERLKKLGGL